MGNRDVLVVGYPRSGNTWLARLIADALNSPLVGIPERDVNPVGMEGLDRLGPYTVRQLHLQPDSQPEFTQAIPNQFKFSIDHYDGQRIILAIRDPRDIAVSAMHYWEIPSLRETIEDMGTIGWPLTMTCRWDDFNLLWMTCPLPIKVVRYEKLLADTLAVLLDALDGLDVANPLDDVTARQSLESRRNQFEELQGHWHPYGKKIQLKTLRKGIVGDWRNHFTRKDGELMHSYFWEGMNRLGYEKDSEWFNDLPE